MADEARINAVVSDIVDGVRAALFKHDVTFEEYRVALAFLLDAFEKNDVPLLMDVFFNTTIVKIEGKLMGGSKPSLEGPYYLENATVVTNRLPMRAADQHHNAMQLRGGVTGMDSLPLARAPIDARPSTPVGRSEANTSELQTP